MKTKLYEVTVPRELNLPKHRLFMKNVLCLNIDEAELATAKVYTEYHTGADRRIDIAIVTNKRFIPIEVKIK